MSGYPSPEPFAEPACPQWCESPGECKWEQLTPRGSENYDVPLGTWLCDHSLGHAGDLVWVYGREFSHKPGEITLAAFLDDNLIDKFEAAERDEMRVAAEQMMKASQMIAAVVS